MIDAPVFAPDLNKQRTDIERLRYVAQELRRLQKDRGFLKLSDVLIGGVPGASTFALELITNGRDPDGNEVVPAGYSPKLKIVSGRTPLDRDPQGRKLPPEKAGKVLVVKTGLVRFEDAKARQIAERNNRSLYETVEVTHEAKAYRVSEAKQILEQWGVGVANDLTRQIVEEVE